MKKTAFILLCLFLIPRAIKSLINLFNFSFDLNPNESIPEQALPMNSEAARQL